MKIDAANIFKYLHMLIGDGRISFVNVAVNSETMKASVEFTQRHIGQIEFANDYSEIPNAIKQVIEIHPTRGFVTWPNYCVEINNKTNWASISALLATKRYLPKTRIPMELAEALVNSPEFDSESKTEGDVTTTQLDFKQDVKTD